MSDGNMSDNEPSINMKAAMMHVIGDLVQSVGVLISAIIIKFVPNAKIIDPVVTVCFACLVICTTGSWGFQGDSRILSFAFIKNEIHFVTALLYSAYF